MQADDKAASFVKVSQLARKSRMERILSSVQSRLSTGKPMDHVLRELLIPPKKRKAENIELLKAATIQIPFFKELATLPKFASQGIHGKLCKAMLHLRVKRGLPVILKSRQG